MPQALRYREHGDPGEVLSLDAVEVPDPGSGEVRLEMLFAAVNPSDFGVIAGSYGRLKTPPTVAGREGLAEVVALGEGVDNVRVGQRVRLPEPAGTWCSACTVAAEGLLPVPDDIPAPAAAMAFINPPTALLLLEHFVDLGPGDWVAQNAANSAVGVHVIQLARRRGLKTLNLVRREELAAPLRDLGADVVVTAGSGFEKNLSELTGGARPRLALNSVGGPSAIELVKVLASGGTHVTFGGMTGEKVRFPTRYLIFDDARLRGFWIDRWLRSHPDPVAAARVLAGRVFELIRDGTFHHPVEAVYPLDQWRQALDHARRPRMGKVLFRGGDRQE